MYIMKEGPCRLYIGGEYKKYDSVLEAKEVAEKSMEKKLELRIELLVELDDFEADFWAYVYEKNEWVPS